MTEEEVKALSAKKTRQALHDLQVYLHNHPSALEVTSDKMREAGRRDEAYLLRRFARGAYPGVPYNTEECMQEQSSSFTLRRIMTRIVKAILVLGVFVFAIAVYVKYTRGVYAM